MGVKEPNLWVPALNDALPKYDIKTKDENAMFLAQCLHESGNFSFLRENLNYSEQGLLATFPKYFNNLTAREYAKKPEKIANRVYANRYGNGPESSGDGFKYRGRGIVHTTFKNNYQRVSEALGADFVKSPELLEMPEFAVLAACVFWKDNNLNRFAIFKDVKGATKGINGGFNGLNDRIKKYDLVQRILNG